MFHTKYTKIYLFVVYIILYYIFYIGYKRATHNTLDFFASIFFFWLFIHKELLKYNKNVRIMELLNIVCMFYTSQI